MAQKETLIFDRLSQLLQLCNLEWTLEKAIRDLEHEFVNCKRF